MGTSYPDRTNATGIWKISDIYKNKITDGTYPRGTTRALFGAGKTPSLSNVIDFVSIATTGNAADFGDLSVAKDHIGSNVASFTRGCWAGGGVGGTTYIDVVDYVTIVTSGNVADFGNLSASKIGVLGGSNNIRGLFAGGYLHPAMTNVIDFFTIAQTGNSTDFGDLTVNHYSGGAVQSPTRCVFHNGSVPSNTNVMCYVEFSSTGNAVDFGDSTVSKEGRKGTSSNTRGVMGGGDPSQINTIDTIQIGTLGNAVDFGDLTVGRAYLGVTSNGTRGVFAGGNSPNKNEIDFVTITSAGNATDFGDLSVARTTVDACSDGHGGLRAFNPRTPELYSPTGRPLRFGAAGVGDLSVKVGGEGASAVALIGFNLISTAGNEQLFGDLTNGARYDTNGCAGNTRMFTWSGTLDGTGGVNSIDYLTFSHKGNTSDFGDATETRQVAGCLANSTRALGAGGGTPSNSNVIDFITIATIGNASDFGDLTSARKGPGGLASTTRGVFGGGTGLSNVMDYVTIASAGNATDFGDLTQARRSAGATSSSTRGVFAGGRSTDSPAAESDVIDYITIGSTGNAQDFGDLTQNRAFLDGTSNSTRAIFTGGYVSSNVNTIDFITIASTGNAADFGDLMVAARGAASGSNCHGGLS